ncbi:integrator complex subunit 2 [Obelidium mucronatum]|nr:integrator complex subunit 2 [Obelidium mucronatum]
MIAIVLHISHLQTDQIMVLNSLLSIESTYFKQEANNTALIDQLNISKKSLFESIKLFSDKSISEQCIHLRLVSAFIGYFKLKLTTEESLYCLHSILAVTESKGSIELRGRLIKLAFCALVVCGDQLLAVSSEKYVETLLKVTQIDHSELTLMIGVYCHTNQLIAVLNMVRSVLNLQITIAPESLSRLRTLFTDKILTEVDIAHRSLSLRKFIMDPNKESTDIIVVYELLKAGIFNRSKIDVKEWVLQSIRHLKPPYHPQFLDLIKAYVDSVIESTEFSRISDLEVSSNFERGAPVQSHHVLHLFQVLYLNEQYFAKRINPDTAAADLNPNCSEYPPSVMDILPINRILMYMERPENRDDYKLFYPSISSLVVSQFPQIVSAASFLQSESRLDDENLIPIEYRMRVLFDYLKPSLRGNASSAESFCLTEPVVAAVLKNCLQDSAASIACLEYLCALESSQLLLFLDCIVDNFFPIILVSGVNTRVKSLFEKLFQCLNSISPRELALKTVKAWIVKGSVTHTDLTQNPLVAFRVDDRVFQVPEAFSVFLQILDCYLTSSRHRYYHTFQLDIFLDKSSKLKESHLYALLDLQESAVMQTLLELCSSEENLSDAQSRINTIACAFIHQQFVLSKKAMKLLHFQGYREDVIPIAVDKISSMHVCFEFLAELIQQPALEKQVFAIQLASRLCMKYPIPSSYSLMVNTVLPKIVALCSQIHDKTIPPVSPTATTQQDQQQRQMCVLQTSLLKVFQCLGVIIEAFPTLLDKIDPFISTLGHPRQGNSDFMKVWDVVRGQVLAVKNHPEKYNKITQKIR